MRTSRQQRCSQGTLNHENNANYLISNVTQKVSHKSRRAHHQEIAVAENNFSPDDDNLPAKSYKTFNEILKTDLHKLPTSMQQAVTSYLQKKEDREDITNWRQILLLKYHNKISTKILVNKIQSALENILAPEQTTVINGRTITENLKLNQDVMSYANANKIQTTMIALDQEKSFDRMENKDS